MATPTKSHTGSTPKPHLSTPNKIMASPRPGTSSNSTRPLAYKSPAVKTPASAQGHGHHVSVSSQPSSTPLAATAIHDDLLALTSPAAALINSLGPAGLTPLGSSGDGLGITTNLQGTPARGPAPPVNPEIERLHRAQLVADTLKRRVAGYGITRDGVERIAQLQGFTTLWDDENLTIAGNTVDLEVNFDVRDRDHVRDVSLKLNTSVSTSDSEEPQFQEQGTEVLKDNLTSLTVVNGISQWRSLDTFASNLQYLSQLDHIEGGAPCFNAVADLYNAFQKIWNAEKERWRDRSPRQHLRRSAIGRASMDRKPKLGLALDYWASKEALNQTPDTHAQDIPEDVTNLYTARISCETGAPSTILTRQWVSERVVAKDSEAMLDTETESLKPDWQDPAQDPGSSNSAVKTDPDDPATAKPIDAGRSILDMHFSCSLLPEVYLPLNVAANLNMEAAMIEMNQDLAVTYQTALQEYFNANVPEGAKRSSEERWLRSLPTANETDRSSVRWHSYALHSSQPAAALWCYPVQYLTFTHPKQLAAALPILRQYALVWSILRSLVEYGGTKQVNNSSKDGQTRPTTGRPLKRSNAKALGSRLDDLLTASGAVTTDEVLPVDLSLDVISEISKARLDIFVPIRGILAKGKKKPFIFVSLNICQGGEIEIKDLHGLPTDVSDASNLRTKIVKILATTEDIGLLVEWLLEQASAQR